MELILKGQEKNTMSLTPLSGKDGISAYEIAVRHGFVGTENEWLDSLKAEIVIDEKVSDTSTNPVQNKAVFEGLNQAIKTHDSLVRGYLLTKQNKLSDEQIANINSISNMGKWTALCEAEPTAESTNMLVSTWDIDTDNFTELMIQLYVPKDSDTTARAFQVALIEDENNIPLFPDGRLGNLFVAQSTNFGKADPTRDVTYLFESRFFTNGDLIKTEMSWTGYSTAAYPQGDYSAITGLSKTEGDFSVQCNIQGKIGIAIKYLPDTCIFPAGTVLRVYGR